MYKVKVDNGSELEIDLQDPQFDWDIVNIKKGQFHILKNYRSHTAEIVSTDWKNKTVVVHVNGQNYTVAIKDKLDQLLEEMGIGNLDSEKVKEIVAPMPGLVLALKVGVGDAIKTGDAVAVLEAMKMENMLKTPGEGVVKSIEVNVGDAVEKGQVLLRLE